MTQAPRLDGRALPEGWRRITLGELGDEGTSFADGPFGSNLKTEHYRSTGARVVRLQNIGAGIFLDSDKAYIALDHYASLQRHSVEPGDIVVAALGNGARPAGRACVIPRDFGLGIVKADCFRVRLPANSVHGPYIVLAMNSEQFLRQVADRMRGATRPRMTLDILRSCTIPLPSLPEQKRIAAMLNEQMGTADSARVESQNQKDVLQKLVSALLRCSLAAGGTRHLPIAECLVETNKGVGESWNSYPVLGATRAGLAPAKEGVGKYPQRYKLVDEGTIFYGSSGSRVGKLRG